MNLSKLGLSPSLVTLIAMQLGMLVTIVSCTGPGWDEWAHLPSGLYSLKYADSYPYRVNPPLVRLIAALPVALLGGGIEYRTIPPSPGIRSEWLLMMAYVHQHGPRVLSWMLVARTAVIPLSLLGTWLIWKIGLHFCGSKSSLAAATLWTFSPMVLTYGATIAPDVGATVFGLWASWCFYVWFRTGKVTHSVWLGVSTAAAMLSKATWIILPPLFLAILVFRRLNRRSRLPFRVEVLRLLLATSISLALIHAAYDFNGVLKPIGSYRFISQTLSGNNNNPDRGAPLPGNRFQNTILAHIPSPLPADYISGIDVQKRDFEGKFHSYLLGNWRDHGWWHYYIVAWLVKEPLGFWLILVLGWMGVLHAKRERRRSRVKRRGLMMVLAPGLIVFCFVSSQTGFNHHLRYVLPAFPAVILIAAFPFERLAKPLQQMLVGLLVWFALSSISTLPRSYAFFSEAIGGSRNGHLYLNSSNLDWGQDLPTMANWIRENPSKRPVYLLHPIPQLDYQGLGIDATDGHGLVNGNGPCAPGWWLVSIDQCLRTPENWFLDRDPNERLSVSTTVYHIDIPEEWK
ncbi:hypothetical protein CA13_11500 [Planctomycetes bacterium CA13]|uniref:Glycosyltransferase RgtA/B/C/D-like domain-containing protein n=1 Tax=Novipirellula herctigrandis TaxID=2527986 RepID=A0A5C5YZA7_9BACT|nr:hypothetical protein CA13_11500 [Planctomycetes bacterium CA13]